MLARTADSLYWTARYIERADFLARVLDAATRLSALPSSYAGDVAEWESAIATAGVADAFNAKHDVATEETVMHFLAFDPDNPSSICSCIEAARANSRAVRTALTSDTWEGINDAWNEMQGFDPDKMGPQATARFLDWVMRTSLAFDGSAHRTMLRNDAYWFLRLGMAIERADNTARLLDVKYHLLLPEREPVGGSLDYFQWTTILREVSALTAYRWVYRTAVKPLLVADLLILNKQMPRSLASCYEVISAQLDHLAEAYGRSGPSQREAGATLARLDRARIERVFHGGLHEFITDFLRDNQRLSQTVAEQYLA